MPTAKKSSVISSFIPEPEEVEVVSTPPRPGTRKPVKPAKKKLTIELPAETHKAWKTFAAGEDRTLQSLIETTVNDYIRRRSK